MLIKSIRLNPFFAPVDTGAQGAIEDKELSKEEVIKLLGDDDAEPEEKLELQEPKPKEKKEDEEEEPEKEKAEGEETEEDELAEIEEELEEPEIDEDLEIVAPARRKEILAKYPNLFKDFPSLEKAYYKEQQVSELLPTMDDVKSAVEKSQALDGFEEDLLKGETSRILSGLKKESPESFNALVDNLLPSLYRTDEKAYHHIVGRIVKDTIVPMVREAERTGNEALKNAAIVLNQFVFGTSEFIPPTTLAKPRDEKSDTEEQRLRAKEQAFQQKQYDNAVENLSSKVDNILKSTIESYIDPKGSMTDYVKRQAMRDASESISSLMDSDRRFIAIKDKLWQRAIDDEFSTESINRIKAAYLSRAKTLLPSVIKKARNEALRGLGKRVKDDSEKESSPKKGPVPVGKSTASSKSGQSTKEQARSIPSGTKTLDYLMQD